MSGTELQKGGNISITQISPGIKQLWIALGWSPRQLQNMEVDASAFILTAHGKIRSDDDFIFYNNPVSVEGAVKMLPDAKATQGDDAQVFRVDLSTVPDDVQRIVFTVTIHEGQSKNQYFGMLARAWARVVTVNNATELARFALPLADSQETALIFCEVYRHRNDWKFRAVGQGYKGGLEPLAREYGVDIMEEAVDAPLENLQLPTEAPMAPAQTPPVAASNEDLPLQTKPHDDGKPISHVPVTPVQPLPASAPPTQQVSDVDAKTNSGLWQERITALAVHDPELAELVKEIARQLAKHGLEHHRAHVALCLDISGSMQGLYRRGSIDALLRRLVGLGIQWDSQVDVFLFGKGAYHAGQAAADNYRTFISEQQKRYPLESGTAYGKVMALVREHYQGRSDAEQIPVYVLFATDGDTSDRNESEQQIREAAQEAIFWQFMAIGTPPEEKKGFFSKLLSPDFKFLAHLDTMPNRFIDNANFFLVRDPAKPSVDQLIEYMMVEYPSWLTLAHEKGLLLLN
jgi:stress response protein SCP2